MSQSTERDYVLGTHDEELDRLGLQHRVWRPRVLDAWRDAGITVGSRVVDVGAGPGYATIDLAEIVGPTGRVVAVERSARFAAAARAACLARGLDHVEVHELDLMAAPIPARDLDAAWCRWVAAFVASPARLVRSIAEALRPGGAVIFHEYADYRSWRLAPRGPALEEFVREVMRGWRASGGEPDIGLELPTLLRDHGFTVGRVTPLVLTPRPADFAWRWTAGFVEVHLGVLLERGAVDRAWVERVRAELRAAEADPQSMMITPLVFEILAARQG